MVQRRVYNWQSDLVRLLTVGGVASGAIASAAPGAIAQSITLDGTLGPAQTLTGPTYRIPQSAGQTVERTNLFHSFGQFGLNQGETALFEVNANVRTILSRVTGGSPSTINGLISTVSSTPNTPQTAVNFFLINPSGIVFGPNARLNIGGTTRGSFIATTTDALVWANGERFSAANPSGADSLLTLVGDPSGFLAGLQPPGPIQSAANLSVPTGQSLVLLGGNVTLDGGQLTASGGRVQVGAVEAGQVALTIDNNALQLSFLDGSPQAALSLLNGVVVNAPRSGNMVSTIEMNARTIALTDATLRTASLRGGGNITLEASDRVSLINSLIATDAIRSGNAGAISIRAINGISLQYSNGTASALSIGTGGNIALETSGEIQLINESVLASKTQGAGNAGSISLRADGAVEIDHGSISTSSGALTEGPFGNAGDIDIQAGTLTLTNGTRLSTATVGAGQGGNITLNALNGSLNIANSNIRTQTSGAGNAGSIAIDSTNSVNISGVLSDEQLGGLFTDTVGRGDAGSITIDTANAFRLFDRAVLDARTTGSGAGGAIRLNANTVEIANNAGILTRTSSTGNAGEIAIAASHNFSLTGNSGLTTSTEGAGNAENISVTAGGAGVIDSSSISTSSGASTDGPFGNAGNVDIQAGTLALTNNARLATTTTGNGQGGDITFRILSGSLNIANSEVQTQTIGGGDAGSIAINSADSVTISGLTSSGTSGGLFTDTSGSGNAGGMTIATANAFRLFDRAVLDARTTGSGAGGAIRLSANTVEITNGGQILTTTLGSGDAGNIAVDAAIATRLAGSRSSRAAQSTRVAAAGATSPLTGLFASTAHDSTGAGGDIAVRTGQLTATDGAQVTARSEGTGIAGGLDITARTVNLNHQARLSAETVTSQAGNIQLRIADSLVLRDRSQISAASTQTGQGGNITVNADQAAANVVRLRGGSRISAQADGTSHAGSVNLNAQRVVVQDGSEISASTEAGRGGDITLRGLESLQVNNSRVAASTQTGQAGSVTVNAADGVRLSGRGGLSVAATRGGVAGSLTVNTGVLAIANGARATVSSPSGQAGNLTVTANTVRLDRGRLSAQTGVSRGGLGANIRLQDLDQLVLRNRSQISADAGDRANGGNIGINATFIVAIPSEDSDIRANAVAGRGGNIVIETQGLFGTQAAAASIPGTSEITASSEQGVQGVVQIKTPDVDPSQGLTELPVDVVDASQLIARSCGNGVGIAGPERSEFVMTGRGGVPLNPSNSLSRDAVTSNWVRLNTSDQSERRSPLPQPVAQETPSTAPIQEAQGWVVNANGEVMLVTQPPVVTSSHPVFASARCSRPPA